jgi:hypothetical protein
VFFLSFCSRTLICCQQGALKIFIFGNESIFWEKTFRTLNIISNKKWFIFHMADCSGTIFPAALLQYCWMYAGETLGNEPKWYVEVGILALRSPHQR